MPEPSIPCLKFPGQQLRGDLIFRKCRQDPSRSNIVEISIPATAVESFLNAVNDQAQQLLLKFAKPQAGNRLEIRKTEHQSEGDAFKKITMEALYEQVSDTRRGSLYHSLHWNL